MGTTYDKRTINSLVIGLEGQIRRKETTEALDTSAKLFGFMLGRIGVMQSQLDLLCQRSDTFF